MPVLAAAWLVYELLRAAIVRTVRRRYERQIDRFLNQHDIPVDGFRHTHRVVVKERVLGDPRLAVAIDERARADGRTRHEVQQQVRGWLDEIVPQFNILAYYKVGYTLGRMIAYMLYNVRLDQKSLHRARAAIPKGAAVVYVSNHRSNADFVVTGFMLSRSVQISYAVGEWARIWPLESLFKAFGSYFVRRGEKDPLYHQTLSAYLQLITKQGVTQAMFPEGGLTRDGRLRPAKVGLLDSMTQAKLDGDFTKPLVFVPVGINFDRVMEDENMVYEAAHGRPKYRRRGVLQKLGRLFSLLGKMLWGWPLNIARFLAKRLKKHGVAAIHFGAPIVFDDWYARQPQFLHEPDRRARWAALQPFADDLLARIGANVPATPVSLVCAALAAVGQDAMEAGTDRGTVLLAMRGVHDRLVAEGRPMALDNPYRDRGRVHEVDAVADQVDAAERLEAVLDMALDVTRTRGILDDAGDMLRTKRWDLVVYYANSLETHAA